MNVLTPFIIVSFVLLGHKYPSADGVSLEQDLRLTAQQKVILDKFKKIMKPRLPHKYMEEEIYLVRWLRARDFDLKKAEEFLLQNLRWRKREKIDSISTENFDDIKEEFPYTLGNSFDKRGQPIVTASSTRRWDLRKAVITGKYKRALKYLEKSIEEATGMLRKMQLEGKNVTQFVLILHLGNFNLYQHGCPRCVTGILEFIDSYENHFPGLADKIILVQTPPVYEAIAQVVKQSVSRETKEALKIYGLDSNVWKRALLEFIDADQLTEEFGGTRKED